MRNIFDQYRQPENRLTHSLASVLHQDRALLTSFLGAFGPKETGGARKLRVIEQSLPGTPESVEGEAESRGLPDALIYSDDGWALIVESKVSDSLQNDQLRRHERTIKRCGFGTINGLAITTEVPSFTRAHWRMVTWKEIYWWANAHVGASQWASILVDYFNTAEARMSNDGYLKEGTITDFAGIAFDPYTYLEAKRVLRLLSQRLRENESFVEEMRLDPSTGRSAITEQARLWDFISFKPIDGRTYAFQQFPHCTVGIGPNDAEAMITFPNGMRPALRTRLHGQSLREFIERLERARSAISIALEGLRAYKPLVRIMQRRYPSQRSIPLLDGIAAFDLRAISGDQAPQYGPPIKPQEQWARIAYDLLSDKRSNIQFQIGVEFDWRRFDELAGKDADRYFISTFNALRPFAAPVVD